MDAEGCEREVKVMAPAQLREREREREREGSWTFVQSAVSV